MDGVAGLAAVVLWGEECFVWPRVEGIAKESDLGEAELRSKCKNPYIYIYTHFLA
jgi:hypothetical protein